MVECAMQKPTIRHSVDSQRGGPGCCLSASAECAVECEPCCFWFARAKCHVGVST
jgi:hypothetical protein